MNRTGSILVIDDEEIMREILEALLTREGYQVRLVSTAAEGLDLARAMPFDAAIVDVMLPGMDGIGGEAHAVALARQQRFEDLAHDLLVVDD